MTFDEMERQYWTERVREAKGSIQCIERASGCSRFTVWRRLTRYGLVAVAQEARRRKPKPVPTGPQVTILEMEIIGYVRRGLSDEAILDEMRPLRGKSTLRRHFECLFKKFGVHGRQALLLAVDKQTKETK